MQELFYNFTIHGSNRGYSYLYVDAATLYSHTRFSVDGGEVVENVFRLILDVEQVLACKHNDRDWVDLRQQPEHHFPGCAYPLFLARALKGPYPYTQIREDDGAGLTRCMLRLEEGEIVERRGTEVLRRFEVEGGIPVRIDWGGAISERCLSAGAAVAGSGMPFSINTDWKQAVDLPASLRR